ncbi:mechanosensitive channel MscK [Bibersteinia trehalosi]|uniref:Mechanosensitive channel MscK n=1 Tax=Bibersteinia trehalosi TaxID=47735 RepID=A0A426FI76_BIBTR|nr:mechanosensitive channel MscK [Bibersteinia trehalosi]RRN03804.1 mechanosensitive channel MscK [Bibersteinia trehalosi]
MIKRYIWIICLFSFFTAYTMSAELTLDDAVDLRMQIEDLKAENNEANIQLIKNLEGSLQLLDKIKKQQTEIALLETKVKESPKTLAALQSAIQSLQQKLEHFDNQQFEPLSIEALEQKQIALQQETDSQKLLNSELNSSVANYRSALEQTRKQITENGVKAEQLRRWKFNSQASRSLIDKYDTELKYLDINNKYNNLLAQNIDVLISLDESQKTEASLKQQWLQLQLSAVQETLNNKRLEEHEAQAKQTEQLKASDKAENPLIQEELGINTDLSQYLVEQTQRSNVLFQDNQRIKSILDNLTKTQREVEEQINALQGTLVLSRIINQQKLSLPTERVNKGLAKDIAKLRVEIFDLSQRRDELYNLPNVLSRIESEHNSVLDSAERDTLALVLKDREKILVELIKTLNAQLTLSSEMDISQKQIIEISDALQDKLQQQSFWVQSNNPLDLSWLKEFPSLAVDEIAILAKYLGFDNLGKNLPSTLAFILFLFAIYGLIAWKKAAIKARLSTLASQVNTLTSDSHWHSPEAMFWTIILALPSGLLFLAVAIISLYLFVPNPLASWEWVTRAFYYWIFFATVLALLRPNGMAYRHFGMPQASNEIFQRIIRQSVWIVVLLLVSSIFSQVDLIGFSNDVIGQVMTIVALALCTFVLRPLLDRGIQEYENAKTEDGTKRNVSLFKLLRLVLFVAPISLIVLIVLGYYYTAVYLIEHLIKSYLIALVWVFGRYFAYRSLTISSRRMAYRRLQSKREKIREQALQHLEQGVEPSKEKPEEKIKISTVNQQIFRVADLVGWVVLFAWLYAIWSDLISVANYLNTVILWEQIENTAQGSVVESITLLNLLRSVLYIAITYFLVKNIAGILEVTVFSRSKFSKGTPHTIIAVLTYLIVTIGSISAFLALGISWGKVQWIFTALSVGLGFGVREIFGSFVSGTILLVERPIRVGDKVTVGNFTGVISRIRLRSTTLIDDENMEVVLPNQAFVTDRFINWTLNNTVTRVQLKMKINSGENLPLVRQLLLQAAEEAEKVMHEPSPSVNLTHFGDGWIEHELNVFVAEIDDRSATRNFLYQRIDQLFKQHQIQIAFNQLDVHVHQAERKSSN